MTVKSSAKRKTGAKRGPTTGQLASQIAELKQANDVKDRRLEDALAKVTELTQAVERLAHVPPTATEQIRQHDPAQKVVNDVLGEQPDSEPVIPKEGGSYIPDHLLMAKKRLAKNHQVTSTNVQIDVGNEEIGQFSPRAMATEGDSRDALDPLSLADDAVIIDNKRYTQEKLDQELFMHEDVCVRLHDTTDETQAPMPLVCNNGKPQYFIRGRQQWVKRYSIEPLLRAKRTTYSQREIVNENGDRQFINIPHTALLYPFEVIKDTEKGKAWIRRILAEPY